MDGRINLTTVEANQSDTVENTLSFDELADLITNGRPIPGIKQIPDTLNSEPPSASKITTPRKKPWEV